MLNRLTFFLGGGDSYMSLRILWMHPNCATLLHKRHNSLTNNSLHTNHSKTRHSADVHISKIIIFVDYN